MCTALAGTVVVSWQRDFEASHGGTSSDGSPHDLPLEAIGSEEFPLKTEKNSPPIWPRILPGRIWGFQPYN